MARGRFEDDEDDRPRRSARRRIYEDHEASPRPKGTNGLATASLIFGVLSFCTGITFLPGLLCGVMGLAKAKSTGTGKGMAIAGILTSLGGLLVSAALVVAGFFINQEAEKNKARYRTENNGRQIGLATQNYSDANSILPKPYCEDPLNPTPKPPSESELTTKLSWRVSVLPFLEQENLYKRFRLGETWDSSSNKPLSQTVVATYTDSDTPLDPATRFRCFYGNGAAFELNQRLPITAFRDGTSNTILYVEGAEKVTWSRFNEYKFDPKGPLPELGHPNRDTFIVVMADGGVRYIRKTVNPTALKAAITRAGGEVSFLD